MAEPTYASSTDRVQAWLADRTLHIRFNHPAKHNALSIDMWEAVPPLLTLARDDDRVRLAVFSGAGEKAFASGADFSQFEDLRAAREAVAITKRWPRPHSPPSRISRCPRSPQSTGTASAAA
jgi:enoyl-CoA hydratase/carnithine racemase